MPKKFLSTCIWCFVLWGALMPAKGFATSYPYQLTDISDISQFIKNLGISATQTYSPGLTGIWEITPLGSEAGNMNLLMDENGLELFSNKAIAQQFGTFKTASLAESSFIDTSKNPDALYKLNSEHIRTYTLTSAWTPSDKKNSKYPDSFSFEIGSLLLAFNDSWTGDQDFDDFILIARPTSPTPIPGAIWLLGSGLLGMAGLRRVTGA